MKIVLLENLAPCGIALLLFVQVKSVILYLSVYLYIRTYVIEICVHACVHVCVCPS